MKSHAAAILPGHFIGSAGSWLHFQAQLKYANLKKLASNEFHSKAVWCELKSISTICTTSGWLGTIMLFDAPQAIVSSGKLFEGSQNKIDIFNTKFPANRPCYTAQH
jgi:hypothetical protein